MGGGARSRSRRDKDGGGRERGHGSDGSALLTVRWGVEENRARRWEATTGRGFWAAVKLNSKLNSN
jgi:hypothetical protein